MNWFTKFKRAQNYFKIDEAKLKSNANKKGKGSKASRAYTFYLQVKNIRVRNLTEKQIGYLDAIKYYELNYYERLKVCTSRLDRHLHDVLWKHHGVNEIIDEEDYE